MTEENINKLHAMMTEERLKGHHAHESEILKNYRFILQDMVFDYKTYRQFVPKILSSLESNDLCSFSYSLSIFFDLYQQLVKSNQFERFDNSIMDYHGSDSTTDKIISVMEEGFERNNTQRLSKPDFDVSQLSIEEKKQMSAEIIRQLQHHAKNLNWKKDQVDATMMQLVLLKSIITSLGNVQFFYEATNMYIDRLSTSEFYQAGRDIAEELVISSFNDGVPEFGFFNSFRLYSNIGNTPAALLYANLSLSAMLRKKPPYTNKYVKEIIWQGMKFFRNIQGYSWAEEMYRKIPSGLELDNYEKRSLDHTYFTLLTYMRDKKLPDTLWDYLQKEREQILRGGVNDATPWLVTLYNVRRLYPAADFGPSSFGFFISVFEMMVPPESIAKYKDIVSSDPTLLKKHLKESLVKLNETRNKSDFVYDNEMGIKTASRLVASSTDAKDITGFLLSMTLKSDFSILFQSKDSEEIAALKVPDVDADEIETLYDNPADVINALSLFGGTSLIWLGFSEGGLYQLELIDAVYKFSQTNHWNYKTFKELIRNEYFSGLEFSDTEKKRNVMTKSNEDYEQEELAVAEKLSIGKLSLSSTASQLYLVKDIELSDYPHNLFLDEQGDFISKRIPVTNILSSEWLLKSRHTKPLVKNYEKSIWIPVEGGDIPLNYLHSNIEDTLEKYAFQKFTGENLLIPLSSDINIVCSHGGKDIAEVQVISQAHHLTANLEKIIGSGKILIFFVCHSGSMKSDFFRNSITSMVTRFITQGYEAVIAPFWALDVTIPRYWLPQFLESLNKGLPISEAVFNANKKVEETYPIPAAWACLHLYGNPDFKIE